MLLLLFALVAGIGATTVLPTIPALTNKVINDAFARIDSNKDNHIDVSEFMALFNTIDANHDLRMSESEYISYTHTNPAIASKVFQVVDRNHDHIIDKAEMNAIFSDYDSNGDGLITHHEFKTEYMKVYHQILQSLGLAVGK